MKKVLCAVMCMVLLCLLTACFETKSQEKQDIIQELDHSVVQSEISFSGVEEPVKISENVANIIFDIFIGAFLRFLWIAENKWKTTWDLGQKLS